MAIKPILLDTCAYIAFKRNQPEAIEIIRNVEVIGSNDMWIAATTIQRELSLFTYDTDFQYIDGLS